MKIITRTKIFSGSFGPTAQCVSADNHMNEWLVDHPAANILEFRYQQARYGDHSIAILYKEEVCDDVEHEK